MKTPPGPPHGPPRRRAERAGLTRDQILAGALALIDARGLDDFTMRGLASHLGVTPMALYNHVRDKHDLLQGVAAILLNEVDFVSDDPDWRERIGFAFRQLRAICLAHAGATRVMEAIDVAPPAVFTLLEVTLAALDANGMSTEDAMRAYALLTNFTLGQVSYELRGPFRALDPVTASRNLDLARAGLVHVAQAATLENWDFDAAFEFGLTTILAGLEQRTGDGEP